MTSLRTKFLTGRVFTAEDDLGIGQGVWDHTDPAIHKFGVGSGGINPRWYPGLDEGGNLFLNYNTLIKSEYAGYGEHGFGFEGDYFVVKLKGVVVFKVNALGAQVPGGVAQAPIDPQFLPSNSGLAELLFPLFGDKTLFAQFNRPAFAGVDSNNLFKVYRDNLSAFLVDFNSTFVRYGNTDIGLTRKVNYKGNYEFVSGNEPRISYHPVSKKCLGLLIEPSSTNLLTKSYAFNEWDSIRNITFAQVDDTVWRTKGLNKPFTFTQVDSSVEHSFNRIFNASPKQSIAASFYYQSKDLVGKKSFTVFVSNSDLTHIFGINLDTLANSAPTFNSNRVKGNGILSEFSIENIGSGIYRIKIVGLIDPSSTLNAVDLTFSISPLGDNNSNASFSGDTSLNKSPGVTKDNWCLVGDAQAEQNYTVTSYIQTYNIPMQRGCDILSLSLLNFRYSEIEGLFQLKFKSIPKIGVGTVILSLQNDDNTKRMDYYVSLVSGDYKTFTVGIKQVINGVSAILNATAFVIDTNRSNLNIDYSNIMAGLTKAVISGETGLRAHFSLLTYE
jgi:hypothetical protein